MPEPRTYGAQTITYVAGAFYGGVMLFVAIATGTVLGAVLLGIPAALTMWLFWGFIPSRTARESLAGFETPQFAIWRDMALTPWDQIAGFEKSGKNLYLRRTSGTRSWLLGLNGIMVTRWDGGQTKDLVGELNARLALWKAATIDQGPTLPVMPSPTRAPERLWSRGV